MDKNRHEQSIVLTALKNLWNGLIRVPRAIGGVIRNLGCLGIFLLPFLIAALWMSRYAVVRYLNDGAVLDALILGGMALLFFGGVSRPIVSAWRTWRESTHTYDQPPGAYRRAWRTGRIHATYFPKMVSSWSRLVIGAGVPSAVVLGGVYLIWSSLEDGRGEVAVFFMAGFALFGVTAFHFAKKLYEALRHRLRYDRAVFVMDHVPAVLGGTVSGRVETGMSFEDRPADGFTVSLTCYKRKPSQGSYGRGPRYSRLWSDETQEDGQLGTEGGGVEIPVSFDVPNNDSPSTLERTKDRILWCVEVTAESGDPPYEQSIEVPVFPRNARSARSVGQS